MRNYPSVKNPLLCASFHPIVPNLDCIFILNFDLFLMKKGAHVLRLYILSSLKFVSPSAQQAIKKAVIFSQILECSKSSEVHSTERNLPLEVKLSCNLVKESLNFSNLVFSNLYFLCLWRFFHFFSDNWRTTWKKLLRT